MIKNNNIYTLNLQEEIREPVKKKEKIKVLKDKISIWNIKADKIRKQFDFVIPNYLIDEIIEKEVDNNYKNLHYLCNLACICGRITNEESQIIKRTYP